MASPESTINSDKSVSNANSYPETEHSDSMTSIDTRSSIIFYLPIAEILNCLSRTLASLRPHSFMCNDYFTDLNTGRMLKDSYFLEHDRTETGEIVETIYTGLCIPTKNFSRFQAHTLSNSSIASESELQSHYDNSTPISRPENYEISGETSPVVGSRFDSLASDSPRLSPKDIAYRTAYKFGRYLAIVDEPFCKALSSVRKRLLHETSANIVPPPDKTIHSQKFSLAEKAHDQTRKLAQSSNGELYSEFT